MSLRLTLTKRFRAPRLTESQYAEHALYTWILSGLNSCKDAHLIVSKLNNTTHTVTPAASSTLGGGLQKAPCMVGSDPYSDTTISEDPSTIRFLDVERMATFHQRLSSRLADSSSPSNSSSAYDLSTFIKQKPKHRGAYITTRFTNQLTLSQCSLQTC
jgi:hypothetical protein